MQYICTINISWVYQTLNIIQFFIKTLENLKHKVFCPFASCDQLFVVQAQLSIFTIPSGIVLVGIFKAKMACGQFICLDWRPFVEEILPQNPSKPINHMTMVIIDWCSNGHIIWIQHRILQKHVVFLVDIGLCVVTIGSKPLIFSLIIQASSIYFLSWFMRTSYYPLILIN